MTNLKTLILTISIFAFTACVAAQDKKDVNTKTGKKPTDEITACEPTELKTSEDLKIIGENANVQIEKPFIFAARSAETYKLLQEKIKDLPNASEIDFKMQAVIAAFGGEQTSGGYSVSISQNGDKFDVKLNKPAPDAMTTDALTYPFKIVIVPIEEEKSLTLETSEIWKNSAENYKVSSGNFVYSGGFAGKQRAIKPSGKISVLRFENLVTIIFNLSGTENKKLNAVASGKIINDKANLARFEAGEFYESPHPPLIANVKFSGNKITISLESGKRDYTVNDGFSGNGKIEAAKNKLKLS